MVLVLAFYVTIYFYQQSKSQEYAGEDTTLQQALTKERIRLICDLENKEFSVPKNELNTIYNQFIVDDTKKILYCFIPKVACSNWKRVMFVLKKGKPYDDPSSIDRFSIHHVGKLIYLKQFNSAERERRLMEYTKFMFVRDPFVRLVSAYRDKFVQEERNEYFYTNYFKYIIKTFGNQSDPPKTMKEANALGLLPSFSDFIKYLLHPQTERMEPFEPHWRQMHRLCQPCRVKYDFVGHLETLQEDAQELLKSLKLENDIKFPSFYQNKTTYDSIMNWFKTVPLKDRRRLYNVYQGDFKLFGYSRPDKLLSE